MPDQTQIPAVTVLVTRPAAQSEQFVSDLIQYFGNRALTLLAPLMDTEYLQPRLPTGPYSGVIFTSIAGVIAVERMDHNLPKRAICVGKASAARARLAGFEAISADGASDALINLLADERGGGRLLHLRGAVSRGNVAATLTMMGVPTDEVVVYRQLALPLSDPAKAVLCRQGPVIVPLFSPRSARLFQDQLPLALCADLSLVLISAAAAEAGAGIPARYRVIAPHPDRAGMLAAIATLLDQIAPI